VSGTPVSSTFNDLRNQLKFLGIENFGEMMDEFKKTAFVHVGDSSVGRHGSRSDAFGNFLFFLRNIFLRHTQNQTYRSTTTTLMSLPPKTERIVEIDFHSQEREHYLTLEAEARSFYQQFKTEKHGCVSPYYLMLTQKLNQSRIACSGGHYPMDVEGEGKADHHAAEEEDDDELDPDKKSKRKKKKAGPVYSEFAFQSKFDTLIDELQTVRDQDPTCEFERCAWIYAVGSFF
jgi:SNF2-related domain